MTITDVTSWRLLTMSTNSSADRSRASQVSVPLSAHGVRARRPLYLTETLRPIVNLAFVLPFLFIYELGAILADHPGVRNGVDVGLSSLLSPLGMGQVLLLPLLTFFILITWHHRIGDNFRFHPSTITGMLLESSALGLILLFAAKAHLLWSVEASHYLVQGERGLLDVWLAIVGSNTDAGPIGGVARPMTGWEKFVSYCGAGLYEELLFRVVLLTGLLVGLRQLNCQKPVAVVVAVAVSSLLFALAHYEIINPAGSAFDVTTFGIRLLGSTFFCVVYLTRGFGIAVGAHVAYDMLALVA